MAERRAGKYQADVYVAGQGTHVSVLYPAKALAPMSPALILPEVKDESKWFKGKHRSSILKLAILCLSRHRGLYISVNTQQAKADEIKSWRDLLNPSGKEKSSATTRPSPGCAQHPLVLLHE
jgi:ABC-type Fe3+ transport system substrate-binding protein